MKSSELTNVLISNKVFSDKTKARNVISFQKEQMNLKKVQNLEPAQVLEILIRIGIKDYNMILSIVAYSEEEKINSSVKSLEKAYESCRMENRELRENVKYLKDGMRNLLNESKHSEEKTVEDGSSKKAIEMKEKEAHSEGKTLSAYYKLSPDSKAWFDEKIECLKRDVGKKNISNALKAIYKVMDTEYSANTTGARIQCRKDLAAANDILEKLRVSKLVAIAYYEEYRKTFDMVYESVISQYKAKL